LKVNKTLTVIYLNDNAIEDLGESSLAEALKINKTLVMITLKHKAIGKGAFSFAKALEVNTSVAVSIYDEIKYQFRQLETRNE